MVSAGSDQRWSRFAIWSSGLASLSVPVLIITAIGHRARLLDTTTANHFNFIGVDLPQGNYDVVREVDVAVAVVVDIVIALGHRVEPTLDGTNLSNRNHPRAENHFGLRDGIFADNGHERFDNT